MTLELFHKVRAGEIETFFNKQNQPFFKRADLGKYLGIRNIRDNFKEFSWHHANPRSEIEGVPPYKTFGRAKNYHDIFINLDSAIEIAVRSKKPRAVALVKWPTKRCVEKIQEEHQQTITDRDNQIKALGFRNEEHQQKILRLNKEIDDLIKNRHVACRGCFDNVLCFIKKDSKETHPYYVIRCRYRQLEKYKRCLKLRYPNMEVTDKCEDPNAIHRWNIFKSEVIEKPNYYKNHFSLAEEKRQLLKAVLDVTM